MAKKVLLIHPSAHWSNTNFPMGLFYLGSFLKSRALIDDLEILNLPTQVGMPLTDKGLDEYIERTKQLLESKDFDYVGISCWTSNLFQSSILMAKVIKEINKNAIIAVGGYHPSVRPSDFQYKESPFDYIIVGEGELPFKEYVLEGNLQNTPRIIKSEQSINLDVFEDLDFDLLKNLQLSDFDMTSLYLSRGCPYNCAFCIEKSKSDIKWRALPPKKSISLIRNLIKQFPDIDTISLFDPLFGFEPNWRVKFLDLLAKEEIDKKFYAEMRVNLVNKELLQLLAKLNFKVFFGVESFSKTMLLIMKKTTDPEKYIQSTKNLINWAEELQLEWVCNLMIGHPGETMETLMEMKQFLMENFNENRFAIPNISLFCYFPGSHVANNLKEYEEKYGTNIKYPEWWKNPPLYGDFLTNSANRLDPSRELVFSQLKTEYISMMNLVKDLKKGFVEESRLKMVQRAFKQLYYLTHNKDFLLGTDLNSIINKIGKDRHLSGLI